MDKWIPPSFLDDAHSAFPDVFILSTEACAGFGADGKGVLLGSWDRGEEYGHFIMQVKLTFCWWIFLYSVFAYE